MARWLARQVLFCLGGYLAVGLIVCLYLDDGLENGPGGGSGGAGACLWLSFWWWQLCCWLFLLIVLVLALVVLLGVLIDRLGARTGGTAGCS